MTKRMPTQHFKEGDEFDRLTRKRNMQLQRELDVRLQILQKEYRMTRERMDKTSRDCTEFLSSVHQKYPGLEVYSQPDTRAMSAQALAQVHAATAAKEARRERSKQLRGRQNRAVVRPASSQTQRAKDRASSALQRPKNAYRIVRRPLSAQQIVVAASKQQQQQQQQQHHGHATQSQQHAADSSRGATRLTSRSSRTQSVIRIPSQHDTPVEVRETRPSLTNGSVVHAPPADGGAPGRRPQQAWATAGEDDVFHPDNTSRERQGQPGRTSRPGTAQRQSQQQLQVNGVQGPPHGGHAVPHVQGVHGQSRKGVPHVHHGPQHHSMTPEATLTTIRPASSHPHAHPRPSESSVSSRATGGILVNARERPTMSAPAKRRVIFADIIKALQECGVKHRQYQPENGGSRDDASKKDNAGPKPGAGGTGSSLWSALRKKSDSSEGGGSNESGRAKLLWKSLVEKVKTTEDVKKRPVSAPATYELYGRSPAVSRQQVAGIMAEIESRRASTRGLLQQSRDLQKYVKKMVGPEILREEDFSDDD